MQKYFLLIIVISSCSPKLKIQRQDISIDDVVRVEKILSSDKMKGRQPFTPEIDSAAEFIAAEFKQAGLQYLNGLQSFKQNFNLINSSLDSCSGVVNGVELDTKDILILSTDKYLSVTETSGYNVNYVEAGENLFEEAKRIVKENFKSIVFVDYALQKDFSKLKRFQGEHLSEIAPTIFVLTNDKNPSKFKFDIAQTVIKKRLSNVVALLPGKTKPGEFVIFSGHYDHLGVTNKMDDVDSIFNGANDDASGTTAVMSIAKYFAQKNDNARSLIFVAFTAEESGGYGSKYFASKINPDSVVAMFNIEMIGTESKWGKNNAYITGYEKSDFGKILQKNLKSTEFSFHSDPYTKEQLFYRSDNATLAALGVPAHTISTSQMDKDKTYHTVDDEFETLDIKNMREIIMAIALSSQSIISGIDTPKRIEKLK